MNIAVEEKMYLRNIKRGMISLLFGLVSLAGSHLLYAGPLESSLALEVKANRAAAASQVKINGLVDKTIQMLGEYKDEVSQYESLKRYNDSVARLVADQNRELKSLKRQMDSLEETNRGIIPLLMDMLDNFEQFVKLDTPFHMEERLNRIDRLRGMMDRSDVSTAVKYQQVLEAYSIEIDFGASIDGYSAKLERKGQTRIVNFLQIGRVAFIYQTSDETEAAVWDNRRRAWVDLDDSYRIPIREALKVSRKQSTARMLTLPVKAPEMAK